MNLSIAISIASKAFENKFDKGGNPYILHCLWVMNKVKHLGETAMICAVMHDLIEDCSKDGYTMKYIIAKGFDTEVQVILELLTHRKTETTYEDYIKGISIHPIARAIKLADLEHNSSITRLKGLRKKDFDRLEKYHHAFTYLS